MAMKKASTIPEESVRAPSPQPEKIAGHIPD
jgi:hypothetical protein